MTKRTVKTQDYAVKPESPAPLTLQIKNNIGRVEQALKVEPLFRDNPEDLPTEMAVAAHAMLTEFMLMANERKEAYRKVLMERAEQDGAPTPKGGKHMWADDNEIIRERRQDNKPNEQNLRILLATKSIRLEEVFDEVKISQLNMSKLQYLIDCGKISQAEIDELRKVSWALKIKRSELVEKLLNNFSNTVMGLPQGTKRLSLKKKPDDTE